MFTLKFETNNDAFKFDMAREISCILIRVASDIYNEKTSGVVFDINGNPIGNWIYEEEEETE